MNVLEKCFSKNFGQQPGTRSCLCRGCYLNCLELEELFIGEPEHKRMHMHFHKDLYAEPTNACVHLVGENGETVVNRPASRLGRINPLIVRQVLGLRYV